MDSTAPENNDDDDSVDSGLDFSDHVPGLRETTETSILGFAEYETDFEKILRKELPEAFDRIEPAALTLENVEKLPHNARGAYMLFLGNVAVYAGKTDHEHGFRNRLGRHFYTLSNRQNLDATKMSFKAVKIAVFSILDVETILINVMKKQGLLTWNGTGIGSNDPGRNRDGQKPGKFDRQFPIAIDVPIDPYPIPDGDIDLLTGLAEMRVKLPYIFRYGHGSGLPKKAKGKPSRSNITITIPPGPKSMRDFLRIALNALPEGWEVTVFPGRVILYEESRDWPHKIDTLTR